MAQGSPTLEVRGLGKTYGSNAVVEDVSFVLSQGEVLTLLGPSGCGKTTTLRLVAGLDVPDAGEIIIRGKTVASASRRIFVPTEKRNLGLVFQSYAVWPHMTVQANVSYPLEVRRVKRTEIKRKVAEVIEVVGLSGLEERRANQLSGGQQQRVALARALAYEPDLLLLDEPLSNLDAKLRIEMRLQIKSLQRRLGTTILYVTHDQAEAMSLSNRVVVMRNGRIEQVGSPRDVYESPASFFVQSFVGSVITLPRWPGEIGRGVPSHGGSSAPPSRLAVRPEDVTLTHVEAVAHPVQPAGSLVGTVEEMIYYGDHVECLVRLEGHALLVQLPKGTELRAGETVAVNVASDRIKEWA